MEKYIVAVNKETQYPHSDSEPNEDEKVVVKSRRHYSKDLRERIIYQSWVLGKSTSEISVDLDISLRVVQHTIQLWNEIGDVVQDPKEYSQRGRPRLMDSVACNVRDTTSWELLGTNPHAQYLLRLLDHRSDLYLDRCGSNRNTWIIAIFVNHSPHPQTAWHFYKKGLSAVLL